MRIFGLIIVVLSLLLACTGSQPEKKCLSQSELNLKAYDDLLLAREGCARVRSELDSLINGQIRTVFGDSLYDRSNKAKMELIQVYLIAMDDHFDSVSTIAGRIMEELYDSGTMMPMMTNELKWNLTVAHTRALQRILNEFEN